MRTHHTSLALIASLLALQLAAAPAWAQATNEAEPPDGPPTEPIKAPEPPIVPPGGTHLTDPTRIAPAAPARNEDPGSEFFVAAAEALRRAQSITYRAKAYATGAMFEPHTAKIQADVRMLRSATAGPQTSGWLIRSTGTGKAKSASDEMAFDVVWTGNNIEFVSHPDKKVIEKRLPRDAKNQGYQIATSSKNDELTSAHPFSKELALSAQYEVGGRQTIDGEECEIVTVQLGEKKAKVRYAFAVSDHLPRKIERIIEGTMASGTMVLELAGVSVDDANPPRMLPESLKVTVPEGYTEERIPKPAAVPPMPKMPPGGETLKAVPETVIIDKPPQDPGESGIEPGVPEAVAHELPTAAPIPPPPPPPMVATPFELLASNGDRISLDSLKGNIVVVEFGGSWCLPCRESHIELDGLLARFSGKPVKVLALSCRDKNPTAAIERFKEKGHSFPLLVEADSVAKTWGVRTYPSYFVIGLDGGIIKTDFAYNKGTTVASLGDAIDAVLNPPAPGTAPAKEEPAADTESMLVPEGMTP